MFIEVKQRIYDKQIIAQRHIQNPKKSVKSNS